jgi:hypothetical protein
MEQTICKFCGQTVFANYYFCPYCGKKLIDPPITFLKEFGIYLFSIFLPPLGLWPGIKYLLQKNARAKRVGIITIILTVLSIAITLWLSVAAFNNINQAINAQLQNQSQFQNIGY